MLPPENATSRAFPAAESTPPSLGASASDSATGASASSVDSDFVSSTVFFSVLGAAASSADSAAYVVLPLEFVATCIPM